MWLVRKNGRVTYYLKMGWTHPVYLVCSLSDKVFITKCSSIVPSTKNSSAETGSSWFILMLLSDKTLLLAVLMFVGSIIQHTQVKSMSMECSNWSEGLLFFRIVERLNEHGLVHMGSLIIYSMVYYLAKLTCPLVNWDILAIWNMHVSIAAASVGIFEIK